MSMSTFVYGIIDSSKIEKAKKVRELLLDLGITDYPENLDEIIEEETELKVHNYTTESYMK